MDPRMLNGVPKVTLIEDTSGNVFVIAPDRVTKHDQESVEAAILFVKEQGWEINVEHLFGPCGYAERKERR